MRPSMHTAGNCKVSTPKSQFNFIASRFFLISCHGAHQFSLGPLQPPLCYSLSCCFRMIHGREGMLVYWLLVFCVWVLFYILRASDLQSSFSVQPLCGQWERSCLFICCLYNTTNLGFLQTLITMLHMQHTSLSLAFKLPCYYKKISLYPTWPAML